MKAKSFLLSLSMRKGSQARQGFGALFAANRKDHPVSSGNEVVGTVSELWRNDDWFCAALLLDAHDNWASLASGRPSLAFQVVLRLEQNNPVPLRILTDKAVLPLLALDSAIARRWDGTSYRLDSLLAFVGRWLAGPGGRQVAPDTEPATIRL